MLHGAGAEDQSGRVTLLIGVLLAAALCGACGSIGTLRQRITTDPAPTPPPAAQLLTQADQLVKQGQPVAARDVYARAAVEPGGDELHAAALYRLARLHADPSSGVRDYRTAQRTFERLLADYPDSAWANDARAWRATLSDLLGRQDEAARLKDEVSKLKAAVHARQAEMTRFRDEASKLKADLQRLKQIDLDLEKRP